MLRIACLLLIFVPPVRSAAAQYQGCPLITQISLEECKTLEKLFFDTGGPNWRNAYGWLRSNQPCDWFGITCVSSSWPRKITRIDLSANNLAGSLPGELARLTELREIRIDNSGPGIRFKKLTGTLPAVIGQLEHLEVLQLGNNDFSGTIPLEYGNLANLRELSLADNALTGPIPDPLANLASIENLDLSGNDLAGRIPDVLGNLTTLRSLNLGHNRLSGFIPASLGSLAELRLLNLSYNELTGPVPATLAQLDKLIWLSLADNRLEGALPLTIASFAARINTCELGGNQVCLPDTPPYAVLGGEAVCGLLREAACKICRAPDCPTLEAIYMSTNGPDWLINDGWLASSAPCEWHGVACSSGIITGLELNDNALSGALPAVIDELQGLTAIDFSGNALRGELPKIMGELQTLQTLNLSRNQLTGIVPLSVATLGARLPTCDFTSNIGLCMPDEAEYAALGQAEVCGLKLQSRCAQSILVTLSNLVAEPLESSARLTWRAETPATNITFEVELLTEAGNSVIGTIAGRLEAPAMYEYTARGLAAGTYTFRVHQKALGGAYNLSEPVTVTLLAPGLVAEGPYPNPFQSETVLQFSAGTHLAVSIELYDLAGQRLRTLFQGTPSLHVPLFLPISGAGLSNGTYLIRVAADGATVSTHTLQKLR